MSGFVYSISASGAMFQPKGTMLQEPDGIEYIDTGQLTVSSEEAAGKIGAFLGIIASIAIPFAAPAIFGAIASSTGLAAGLGLAMSGGVVTGLAGVLGSAVVGGIANAGIAYLSGARGGDVWRAAGIGALSGGIGGLSHVAAGAANAAAGAGAGVAAPTVAATTTAAPGVALSDASLYAGIGGPITGSAAAGTAGAVAAPTLSNTIIHGITSAFGNIGPAAINRIGSVLINAAVNNQSMGRLDGLVRQQKAELDALKASDTAAYNQKISAAQQIMAAADRADPQHAMIQRIADVAGMDARLFDQTIRNIAVHQGGQLDTGQRKAYQRSFALTDARNRALAGEQAFTNATALQNNLRATGAGLLGPNEAAFQNIGAQTELLSAQERARREADNSTWGGAAAGLFGTHYNPSTSPDPSAPQNGNDDTNSFINSIFRWGQT